MMKFRPWGFWIVLWQWPLFSKGPRYKLKSLYFKRGGAISMQRHTHRTEDWRCVFGEGDFYAEPMVINGRKGFFDDGYIGYSVKPNQWHRYEAKTPSLFLETQRGICMESDIERA
jgi:mannose-6-phosphate isomerase-like protein (cupin superfamily)